MASSVFASLERKLGVPGKLLIAPVFILVLFAAVTFFSVFEFQELDRRMNTVARDLAPDTAIGTESVISVYRMRLRVIDYYATGHEEALGWAIKDLADALELLDTENGPEFVQVYLDTVVEELANYQAAVQEMLEQQNIVVSVKRDKLDVLGPEIASMARELEGSIFAALEVEADAAGAGAETDLALRFTLIALCRNCKVAPPVPWSI